MFKNISIGLICLTISMGMQAQSEFTVNTSNSQINWKGFKPTGEHYGTIMVKEGNFKVDNNKITGGEFIIDMHSIVNLDMEADNKYNAKLVNHLKSDDFFGVEKFPTAIFKITSTKIQGDKVLVKGHLTIKNKTNPISFLASANVKGSNLTLKSETFKIDRSKWNLKYKSKSFFENLADKFIYDDMEISIALEASI